MSSRSITAQRAALIAVALAIGGCHADPDDAAGQAGELNDAVRRQNAISNLTRLYTTALSNNNGDRQNAAVKAIADASIEKLTQCYIDHPEDSQNGLNIINLLFEMRDARSIPALTKALPWRAEVNEEHAIRAAQTLRNMEIPESDKEGAIAGITDALERVNGARPIDNRMRIEFINALGAIGDRRATPALVRVATAQVEEQNFLINRLAVQQLGRLADPASVPALVKCLFLFAPSNPQMRVNDVAAEALVRIGRPAYEPLLAVLRGQDAEVMAIVATYIEAVRVRVPQAAAQMTPAQIVSEEATFALGALGVAEALDPLLAETQVAEAIGRHVAAAIALVRLNHEPADLARVREALTRVYEEAPTENKPQLIVAMRHLYDAEIMPFFLAEAADQELHPDVRLQAVEAYAMLANAAQVAALRAVIAAEPLSEDGGYRENFSANEPVLAAATECNEDLACWIGKLNSAAAGTDEAARTAHSLLIRKACYMLGRYGRDNEQAIAALVGKLDHATIEVRLAALTAIDRIAVRGNAAAVAKIEDLREHEEGRSIWTNFSREALPTQARLRNRAPQG
jgi:hypothetical protein